MITLIKTPQKNPQDIFDDVKIGKIHIVCMAWNGLTHLNVYGELFYKLPKEELNQFVDLVNSSRETGTLFPKANISILPVCENENHDALNLNELTECIKDVFIANQMYLKSDIIYFTLENAYIDKRIALRILEDFILKNASANQYVKTIWFEE